MKGCAPVGRILMCPASHLRGSVSTSAHEKGPAASGRGALLSSVPTSGRRRCPGERRREIAPPAAVVCPPRVVMRRRAPRRTGGAYLVSTSGGRVAHRGAAVRAGGRSRELCGHRAGRIWRPQPFDPALCVFRSAGRPRASPEPAVYPGDRAAVPCRPVTSLERGPTTRGTIRTPHRSRDPRVVLSGPPLAGADTGTTRRTARRSRAVRVRAVGHGSGCGWGGRR